MSDAPIRFEVLVNGEPFATSGVGNPYGVLSAVVNWVRRNPATISDVVRSRTGFDEVAFLAESCTLEVSSLDSATNEHGSWGHRLLKEGDVITIRVLSGGEYDPPSARL